MTNREKRCEDCACLISKNGVMCCDEMWGKPCNDLEECPEGIELEEIEEITTKAKENKVDHGISGKKRENKPRTVKISDEKQYLFKILVENLNQCDISYEILKENKLISVQIAEKTFKIDLIEQRKPKK